jgi:hypothetical protein
MQPVERHVSALPSAATLTALERLLLLALASTAGLLAWLHAWLLNLAHPCVVPPSLVLAAAMTAAVAVLTYASVCVLLRCTERTGKLTYAALMEAECTRWAGVAVRLSIILGSAGFLVLYLIILADLLVGG